MVSEVCGDAERLSSQWKGPASKSSCRLPGWLEAGSSVPGPDSGLFLLPPSPLSMCCLPQRRRAEGKADLDTKIKYSSKQDSLLRTCKQPLKCHSIVEGLKTSNAAVTFPREEASLTRSNIYIETRLSLSLELPTPAKCRIIVFSSVFVAPKLITLG